jgi:hypothetical protein
MSDDAIRRINEDAVEAELHSVRSIFSGRG